MPLLWNRCWRADIWGLLRKSLEKGASHTITYKMPRLLFRANLEHQSPTIFVWQGETTVIDD